MDPYLNTCATYLNTLIRLSAPYLNTCIVYLNTLSRLSDPSPNTLSRTILNLITLRKNPNLTQNEILVGSQSESTTREPSILVSQSESSITVTKKTQTLSARMEDPSRLSAPVEPSRLAIAYLNTWRVLHPPIHSISSHCYS